MSGNRVFVRGGLLIVEPRGLDKVWSFTRRIEVPLPEVEHAFFDPSVVDDPKGWRGPGLHLPGKVAGVFHKDGRRRFWNVSSVDRAIIIVLADGSRFEQLILTVDDPLPVVDAVNAARRANPAP